MQYRYGYKGMVTTPESPAAWEEGRQLNRPTTLRKPIGGLMLPETVEGIQIKNLNTWCIKKKGWMRAFVWCLTLPERGDGV